jgi:hypothetical protein
MKKSFTLILCTTLLLAPGSMASEKKPIVAVFDVQAKRIELDAKLIEVLSDHLATRLTESGAYQVVSRADIKARLQKQKKASYKKCYDKACQIALGREMAAEKTLATQVLKMGNQCTVNVTLLDLRKATTEKAASVKGACNEEGIVASVEKAVDQLLGIKREAPSKPAQVAAATQAEIQQPGTSLYWMRCPVGKWWSGTACEGTADVMNWFKAVKACPQGYRLPTRQEYLDLLGGCDDAVIKGKKLGSCRTCQKSPVCSLMFGKDSFWYWSIQQGTPNAWGINFKKGRINDDIEGNESYVRCVRSDD